MEIKPPWSSEHNQYVRVFPWRALGVQRTYNVVVGAADGFGGAGVASANTDDGEGRAVQANEASDVPKNDTEQTEEQVARRRVGLQTSRDMEGERIVVSMQSRGSLTSTVLLQHCSEPVLQLWRGTSSTGVATARRGRARVVKATARENILDVAWLVSTSGARVGLN